MKRQTVNIEEAAKLLGISRAQAYKAARSGDLPTLRFGRRIVVPIAALEALLGRELDCVDGRKEARG